MSPYKACISLFAITAFLSGCGDDGPDSTPPKDPAVTVLATAETTPVPDAEDAADDPAIWVNREDPTRSLIVGTNKKRGLVVYDLAGKVLSSRDDGRLNNVDLRQDVQFGDTTVDVVAATNRTDKTIAVYKLDGATGTLTPLLSFPSGLDDPYGTCMYRNPTRGDLYILAGDTKGTYDEWQISGSDPADLKAEKVRTIVLNSQAEGCAADDENGLLFIAEEDVGLYAYWADPQVTRVQRDSRVVIDTVANGHLTADAEGVAVYPGAGGGYVIVSSQGSNSYTVYDRTSPFAFRGTFVIGPSSAAGIDGVEETDGIDATTASLGGPYGEGLFIAQDGYNYEGADSSKPAHQNFKLVPWSEIRTALKLPENKAEPAADAEDAPAEEAPASKD